MKAILLILSLAISQPAFVQTKSPDDIGTLIEGLSGQKQFCSDVKLNVTLPITQQDVNYDVKVETQDSKGDNLSAVKYLIEARDSTDQLSFYSYFDGNYFNYSGDKLREYHWDYDSIPFKYVSVGKRNIAPVHKSGLYAGLIPAYMAEELRSLIQEKENKVFYTSDTVISGTHNSCLKIYEWIQGNPSREFEYHFDSDSKRPIYYQIISNPGSMSEQTLTANYGDCDVDTQTISQQLLMDLHKDIFQKYRTSNFSLISLKGTKLPIFSLPTTTAERYTWSGDFLNPTLIVFLDSQASMTAPTIQEIRKAIEEMPFVTTVLWIFKDKDLHSILEEMPETRLDEYALVNGKSLAADCGVTGYPSVIIADKGGMVKDVIIGYNNNLKADVIQKTVVSIQNKNQ